MKTKSKLMIVLLGTAGLVQAAFVTIGDPGNAADTTGYGAVGYTYQISVTEVTIAEFQASGAGSGNENYWNDDSTTGSGRTVGSNAPASNVSLYEAQRYCNWLTTGDVNSGYYGLGGSNLSGLSHDAYAAANGLTYFLPTEDEWYKAAYYTGSGYSDYANGTGAVPTKGGGATGWNYDFVNSSPNYVRDTALGSVELNGTVNMMGNVYEWMEAHLVRGGGYYDTDAAALGSSVRHSNSSANEYYGLGFRVVKIVGGHSSSTIISISHFSGDVFKMVVDCPTPWSSYPKSKIDLTSGSWSNIEYSTNSAGPFAITNMGLEAGTNTIYLESTNTSAFFGIGEE